MGSCAMRPLAVARGGEVRCRQILYIFEKFTLKVSISSPSCLTVFKRVHLFGSPTPHAHVVEATAAAEEPQLVTWVANATAASMEIDVGAHLLLVPGRPKAPLESVACAHLAARAGTAMPTASGEMLLRHSQYLEHLFW